jgi:hypothetical protein
MQETAVYSADTSRWYKQEDINWTLVVEGVVASTYPEAFELLFGHPVQIPPVTRAPRRESAFGGD